MSTGEPTPVWYVAYGSNLLAGGLRLKGREDPTVRHWPVLECPGHGAEVNRVPPRPENHGGTSEIISQNLAHPYPQSVKISRFSEFCVSNLQNTQFAKIL